MINGLRLCGRFRGRACLFRGEPLKAPKFRRHKREGLNLLRDTLISRKTPLYKLANGQLIKPVAPINLSGNFW